jgi:hypothetical protein
MSYCGTMAFAADLYDGYALLKMGGRSFDIHTEIATGPAQVSIGVLESAPDAEADSRRKWHGHFVLEDAAQSSDFSEALAEAVNGGHDVELQLPTGEQARIEIEGDRFTGLDRWPLG